MLRKILAYGHPTLRKKSQPVSESYPNLEVLIADMWHTMKAANGCGLSAVQIGLPISLFIVDSQSTYEYLKAPDRNHYFAPTDSGIRQTFINARIISRSETAWRDEEGCLSIPGVAQSVARPWEITLEYQDHQFKKQHQRYCGLTARMIQHEYDHTQGILFLDHLKPLTKRLIAAKLVRITKGKIAQQYPMDFIS